MNSQPSVAASAAQRMPAELRERWVTAAVEQLVGSNLDAAASLIEPFASEPRYASWQSLIEARRAAGGRN